MRISPILHQTSKRSRLYPGHGKKVSRKRLGNPLYGAAVIVALISQTAASALRSPADGPT